MAMLAAEMISDGEMLGGGDASERRRAELGRGLAVLGRRERAGLLGIRFRVIFG